MKLSIVIPAYNVYDYLAKTVESLLCQNLSECEILLIDDGSTDNKTPDLCDKLQKENPLYVKAFHKINGGLGDARNYGAEKASGDYIFFLDGDDYVEADAVDIIKEHIEKNKSDIVIFGYKWIRSGNADSEYIDKLPADGIFSIETNPELVLAYPSAATKLWKREFLIKAGIVYPSRVWYEDIRTTVKLFAMAESVSLINKAIYCYVDREGSITKNGNIERNKEIIYAFDDLLGWYTSKGLYEKYYTELEALTVFHILLTASVRVARIDCKSHLLKEFFVYTKEKFPKFSKNIYIKKLPFLKKLALFLVKNKLYFFVYLLFKIKG